MTLYSTIADCWLGLCRKAPVVSIATQMAPGHAGVSHSVQPGKSGNTGSPGRIRLGISIAAEGIRALFRERGLLWFSLLSCVVILFMVLAEQWNLAHIDFSFAATNLISIPFSNSYLIVFDLRLFQIEVVCLSAFAFILAAIVRYRDSMNTGIPVTFRYVFADAAGHARTLVALSVAMAFAATLLLEITAQNEITGKIEFAISMAMFWLPYAYYFAPNGIFSALFFSFRMMVANIMLFLLASYLIPVIVMEGKGLFSAITGSARLIQKTGRELLGCTSVLSAVVLTVASIGLLIGQSPALLNHDYDFFLQVSRGQFLMTAVCYGYLLGCGVLMALGSTVLGIAITDMYAYGTRAGGNTLLTETGIPSERAVVR